MNKTITSLLRPILTLLVVLFSTLSFADSPPPLNAFHATYKVVSEGSISLEGESERILTISDDQWHFASRASALFAVIEESSQFVMDEGLIQPQQYLYNRKVLGKKRRADLSFNWQRNTVENNVENKPWSMHIKPGVQDKLSYQLQLQADVAAGKDHFSYEVADGGKLKHYQFAVTGTEKVSTPAGEFQAVRVERVYDTPKDKKTLIWFAPELDYQLIKLHRQEKKDKTFSISLKEIKR